MIAAYLESSVIGETVHRLKRQMKGAGVQNGRILVVASDAETLAVASRAGAQTLHQPPNGKPAAVNAGIAVAAEDVVVLTDANTRVEPDNWAALTFSTLESASLVSGNKVEDGRRERAFWRYERLVKGGNSADTLNDSLSVVGEFLAFRAEDFRSVDTKTLLDDVETAASFDRRGLRTVVDSRIVVAEQQAHIADQWERRIRIATGVIETSARRFGTLVQTNAGRRFLLHKSYRVTLGAVGFWLCVAGLIAAQAPIGAVGTIAALAACLAIYWLQPAWIPDPIGAVSSAVALQFVPIFATARVVKRALGRGNTGWKKVAR